MVSILVDPGSCQNFVTYDFARRHGFLKELAPARLDLIAANGHPMRSDFICLYLPVCFQGISFVGFLVLIRIWRVKRRCGTRASVASISGACDYGLCSSNNVCSARREPHVLQGDLADVGLVGDRGPPTLPLAKCRVPGCCTTTILFTTGGSTGHASSSHTSCAYAEYKSALHGDC